MNKSLKKGNDNRKCLRRFSIMKQTNKESQTINCTVTSCKYNNGQRQLCELLHQFKVAKLHNQMNQCVQATRI